jgi:hypothetical protein
MIDANQSREALKTMPTPKDIAGEAIRQKLSSGSIAIETERADCGLTTLSFQSVTCDERHVWIDTDSAGEMSLDLEDWTYEAEWDNSVAHAYSRDPALITEVARAWLSGTTIEICKQIGMALRWG